MKVKNIKVFNFQSIIRLITQITNIFEIKFTNLKKVRYADLRKKLLESIILLRSIWIHTILPKITESYTNESFLISEEHF